MSDDNIDWHILYPRGGRSRKPSLLPPDKPRPNKEKSSRPKEQSEGGLFSKQMQRRIQIERWKERARRRQQIERQREAEAEARLEKEFDDEMRACGREDMIYAESDIPFEKWKRQRALRLKKDR